MPARGWDLPASVAVVVRGNPRWYQWAVDIAAALLRSKSGTTVPVDTGRLRRSFRRKGSGFNSVIWNPVKYASYCEDGIPQPLTRRGVELTLNVNAPIILARLRRSVGESLSWSRPLLADQVKAARVEQAREQAQAIRRIRDEAATAIAAADNLFEAGLRARGKIDGSIKSYLAEPRWSVPTARHVLHQTRVLEGQLKLGDARR